MSMSVTRDGDVFKNLQYFYINIMWVSHVVISSDIIEDYLMTKTYFIIIILYELLL